MIVKDYSLSASTCRFTAEVLEEHNVSMFNLYGDHITIWFHDEIGIQTFALLEPPFFTPKVFKILMEDNISDFDDFLRAILPLVEQVREARAIMEHEGLEERQDNG